MIKRWMISKRVHLVLLMSMSAVMLLLNVLTPMLSDDFLYAFSIKTWERLNGDPSQLVESAIAHGEGINGRYFSHFFAQYFLTVPPLVFDLVNTAIFMATVYLVYLIANRTNGTDNCLLLAIFGSMWLFEHAFGQVNLWLDGSCNYLFALFFGILFLWPFLRSLSDQRPMSLWLIFPHMLLSFMVGGYLEPLSVGVLFAACLFCAAELFYYKNLRALCMIPSVLCGFLGMALMVFAPAESRNKLTAFSVLKILEIFGIGLFVLASIAPILILWYVFFKRIGREGGQGRTQMASVILLAGALAANFVLLLANNYPLRCSAPCIFLSILATSLLWGRVQDRSLGRAQKPICLVFAIALGVVILTATVDNLQTRLCIKRNEEAIAVAKEAGASHVELEVPAPWTRYNAARGIVYIGCEEISSWPNPHVARYYELDSVIGKKK